VQWVDVGIDTSNAATRESDLLDIRFGEWWYDNIPPLLDTGTEVVISPDSHS
jgi:hypothetical protein